MKRCHKCGEAWVSGKQQPGVREYCETCSAYLRCCVNCRFHDKSRHNECRIGTTEWVGDREGGNFCDEFEFKDSEGGSGAPGGTGKAKEEFDSLFGGGGDDSGPGLGDFKKLFGD